MVIVTGCGGELAESVPASPASIERPRVVADPDVDEDTVRVHFASSTSRYIVEAAACSLQLRVDDTHVFDIRAGDRRCATTPMPDAAIPVVVRAEKQHVVLEATTAAEVSPAWLRLVLPQIARALEDKLGDAQTRLREVPSTPTTPNHGVKSGAGAGIIFFAVIGGVGLLIGALVAIATSPNNGFRF